MEVVEGYNYEYPPLELFETKSKKISIKYINEQAVKLQQMFYSFNLNIKVQNIAIGPTIITYQIELPIGVSTRQIKRLEENISLTLGSRVINIEQVPNKKLLGLEVERTDKEIVQLGEIVKSGELKKEESKIPIVLGKKVNGTNMIINLDEISHILISGATGSGKSMCVHSIINSILYNKNPFEVKLLMIDTKATEMPLYNGIPHLLIPVISDIKKANATIAWLNQEMENRYKLLASEKVKDIEEFNNKVQTRLPSIILIIDDFIDLVKFNKKETEELIYSLTQRARKVGIHIIIASGSLSTKMISGTIKANIPTRIALHVFSQEDSKMIIDMAGAEKLFGNGDMLYRTLGVLKPIRIQGSYISEDQIKSIVKFLKDREETMYNEDVIGGIEKYNQSSNEINYDEDNADPLLSEAIEYVIETGKVSTIFLKRKFKIGYARAGRIIDQMEERGIISEYRGLEPRDILIKKYK